jgi:flagellar motor switch protein FliM
MSDVLSSDQIAALFAAAEEGQLPDAEAQRRQRPRARVTTIDFSRPSKFSKDQERQLRRAHETFCRTAASRLSSELRTPLDLEVIGVKQLTWTTAVSEIPAGSLSAVLALERTDRMLLLTFERPFILCMLERLLGGEADAVPEDRRLSDIDVMLARQVVQRLLDQLSVVWQDMAEVSLELAEFDPDPQAAQLAPLSEPTVLLTVEARLGRSSFVLCLLLPYRCIEPIEHRLPGGAHEQVDRSDDRVTRRVQAAIGEATIELRAEVAWAEMPAEEVLALRPGDLVRFDASAADGVTVYADNVPVHRARPGRSGRRRAVQVLGRAQEGG